MRIKDLTPGMKVRVGNKRQLEVGESRQTAEVKVLRVGRYTNVPTDCGMSASKEEVAGAPVRVVCQVRGHFGQPSYRRNQTTDWNWPDTKGRNGKPVALNEVAFNPGQLMSLEEFAAKNQLVEDRKRRQLAHQEKLKAKVGELKVAAAKVLDVDPDRIIVRTNAWIGGTNRYGTRIDVAPEAGIDQKLAKSAAVKKLQAEVHEMANTNPVACER